MFTPGQVVVCVDDSAHEGCPPSLLVKGRRYTIKEVGRDDRGVTLYEVEVPNTSMYILYIGWKAERFAPIKEDETDISIFTELLTPVKESA